MTPTGLVYSKGRFPSHADPNLAILTPHNDIRADVPPLAFAQGSSTQIKNVESFKIDITKNHGAVDLKIYQLVGKSVTAS